MLLCSQALCALWASCQIRKIAGCACTGNAGNVFLASLGQRSRQASRCVSDARAVMHAGVANWWFPLMSVAGKTFPGIPGACATRNCTYLVKSRWNAIHKTITPLLALVIPCATTSTGYFVVSLCSRSIPMDTQLRGEIPSDIWYI